MIIRLHVAFLLMLIGLGFFASLFKPALPQKEAVAWPAPAEAALSGHTLL